MLKAEVIAIVSNVAAIVRVLRGTWTQRNPASGAGGASKPLDSRQPSEFDINEVLFRVKALAQEHGGETSASGPMQLQVYHYKQ